MTARGSGHVYLLLVIIYIGYVSLGLPDTVLGVAWPGMRVELGCAVEMAGILATSVVLCSAVSGFSSGFFINRVAPGVLLMASSFMTGGALLGFGLSPSFGMLMLLCVPLGLGGGCIDAGMNSYVARHYSSRHMSWLHGCWGVGATRGPAIMTTMMVSGGGWRSGYWLIAGLQLSMGLVFLLSMRFWGGASPSGGSCMESREEEKCHVTGDISAWCSVVFFFCYCGVEYGFGLWGVTFLINCRGFELEAAGYALALYWGALSCGRFISGVIADGVGNRRMIWAGIVLTLAGQLLLLLPFASWMWGAVVLMGLGLSPIYPCMMHETPRRFSARRANVVMGFQSGSAALGIAVLPFLTGYLGGSVGFRILPFVLTGILLLLPLSFTLLNRRADRGGSGV